MIWLVTGGRDYANAKRVDSVLRFWLCSGDILVHGDADGADSLCRDWCVAHGVHHAAVPALWGFWRAMGNVRVAGYKRNRAMLLLRPDACISFPGGRGTADMARAAIAAGIPVLDIAAGSVVD
jgi:hypothetical protein